MIKFDRDSRPDCVPDPKGHLVKHEMKDKFNVTDYAGDAMQCTIRGEGICINIRRNPLMSTITTEPNNAWWIRLAIDPDPNGTSIVGTLQDLLDEHKLIDWIKNELIAHLHQSKWTVDIAEAIRKQMRVMLEKTFSVTSWHIWFESITIAVVFDGKNYEQTFVHDACIEVSISDWMYEIVRKSCGLQINVITLSRKLSENILWQLKEVL